MSDENANIIHLGVGNVPTWCRVAFISGHTNLSKAEWSSHYADVVDKHIDRGGEFVVGNSSGCDRMALVHLHERCYEARVTIYHLGARVRGGSHHSKSVGDFTSHPDKDAAMTRASHFDIAWVRDDADTRRLLGDAYIEGFVSGTARNRLRRVEFDDPLVWERGDLLRACGANEYIAQQLNCVAVRPHGLSKTLAVAFPYSDLYPLRRAAPRSRNWAVDEDHSTPGHIAVRHDPEKQRPSVVGLFAQYVMGRPSAYYSGKRKRYEDTAAERERWFSYCLRVLRYHMTEEHREAVTFPGGIGCNLAGGSWPRYVEMLRDFARNAPFRVRILCIDDKWLPE